MRYFIQINQKTKTILGAYSISKAALEQLIHSWHLENKKSNVNVYIFILNLLIQNLEKL